MTDAFQDGPTVTVAITDIAHKGDGVAVFETEAGEKRIFVGGALPGETVRIGISGEGVNERGRVVEVVEGSHDRVEPACPVYDRCGGCSLQHWDQTPYLAWKRAQVRAAFADRGLDVEVAEIVATGPASRRRAVIAVQRRTGAPVAGFRERLSHTVVDGSDCLVISPRIRAGLPKLVALSHLLTFGAKGAIFTVLDTETGLDVSVGDATLAPDRRQQALSLALELGLARFSIGREIVVEAHAPVIRFGGIAVMPPPGGFIQAVAEAEEAMAKLVEVAVEAALAARPKRAKGPPRVADLFAGCGTFSLRLARLAQVHAVESERGALDALSFAARHTQGLKPVSVEVRDLYRRPLMGKELAFDAVVIDPPRDGAAPQFKELAKSSVPVIVAISCNPATLARDARYLVDAGWTMGEVTPIDQFLWSHHVEAVVVFTKG
ncbi:class I SAM-dependent RNA methyltransferase [Pinisolibacter aquiterrae]|uniref:class I SAM-dependent RNA methyltransferase n=1 Tax=Pinisolibacter aquiterrae TaxID=2815579 RepID=UPI001C3DBA72|nr:class I SAM-dependent RNA methyltransferase [Pinisolibacter aquiterrae]MCC8237010.1 class I SAM-dependent RNA methyltransferase [Pinisolibacter aquiterrae]